MKKLFGSLFGLALFLGVGAFANANCVTFNFQGGDSICLALDKSGSEYQAQLDSKSLSSSSALRCEILLPNDKLMNLGSCDGSFKYTGGGTKTVKVYVRYQNTSKGISDYVVKEKSYNFDSGKWSDSSSDDDDEDNNNDDISLKVSDSNPDVNENIDVTVNTDSSYRGYVEFYVKYKDGSSWTKTTSSSYFTASSYFSNGYKMTSSDSGKKKFTDFIKFKKSGTYRLYVEDDDGNESYIQINVDTDDNSDNDEIGIKANDTAPDTDEYVDITVNTDSSYRGYVEFYVKYKDGSSWTKTTSSSYFTANSYFSNGYKMTSSDSGKVKLTDFIKFKKSLSYRLYVKDDSGNESYVQFDVDGSGSDDNNDEIDVTANDTAPDTDEYVDVTVKTDSSYRGYVNFYVKYKDGSTWTKTSSSSYFTASSYFSNGYKMTSSDSGKVKLTDFIKFKKDLTYRLYVKDDSGNEDYIQFTVGDGDDDDNNGEVDITANDTTPDTDEYVDVTVKTDSSYRGYLEFTLKYKDGSTWYSTTSSSYFTADDEFFDGYKMTSSDSGKVKFTDFIKFKKSLTYRLYVEDDNGDEDYIEFKVDGSSSSSTDLKIKASNTSPSKNKWIDVTVNTDSDYRDFVDFHVKYKDGSDWIKTESNSYFEADDYFWDGYKMTSSNDGTKKFSSFIEFKKNGTYRLYAKDKNGNESYVQIKVDGSSSSDDSDSKVDGFTKGEYKQLKDVYNLWPDVIAELERDYPKLKKNSYWKDLSSDFYNDMEDVINDKNNRDFQDYDDFYDAFMDWYSYTSRNR